MARQKNDGKGRLGGRSKGTPNKVTGTIKEWLSGLIDSNRQQVENDLQALEPKERVALFERFLQYVVPKQTQIDLQAQIEAERKALEVLLNNAPDEAVERIAAKIIEVHDYKAKEGANNGG